MLGLETLYIAGLPSNKLELDDGLVPCAMPFRTREEAEATFDHWVATVARWKDEPPVTSKEARLWKSAVAGYEFTLELRRLDVRVPFSGSALYEFHTNFWAPELWPSSGAAPTSFAAYSQAQQELSASVWSTRRRDGCMTCSKTDVVLGEHSVLCPSLYAFRPGTWGWVGGEGDYLRGVPEVVAEVAAPATCADDRAESGRRAAVFARAGVATYWLVDPGAQTLSVYSRDRDDAGFHLVEELRPGDVFRPRFPEEVEVDVSKLFTYRYEVPPVRVVGKRPATDDRQFAVPDEPIDIEHLLLAGHPLRRYEVLDDVAPCVLAFRDRGKARRNFEHWARQAARLEDLPCPPLDGGVDEANVGRFSLWIDEHRVHLDLEYSARVQREILEVFALPGVWATEPLEASE